jgi:Flp pilus assembly protein TadG
MKGHGRGRPREQEGAVAVLVAILLVVLLAAVAMTVDAGGLYLRRRALVNGSDSAALAAARTCARVNPGPAPFDTPESSADYEVQANSPITQGEVAGTNITAITQCGLQSGHVSVQYTSQQALYFAPVLGFSHQTPVTTTATASWSLGSNNPVPIVLSSLLGTGACPVPPSGTPTIGQTCSFWYDNDSLGGGNFAFLSLDPAGWNVASDAGCNQSGGANTLTDWISGARPASVSLNWTDPTYVCSDSGIKGVGSGSQVWSALKALQGSTRDFPINWEGPGAPVTGAPVQGTVWANNTIDKYDIIGFAALTIVDVVNPQQAGSTPGATDTCSGKTGNKVSDTILPGTYTWIDFGSKVCSGSKLPPSVPVDAITNVNVDGLQQGTGYTFDTTGITLNAPVPPQSNVSFTWTINPTYGPCGPPPPNNNSAKCVITSWQGSTLTGDYQGSIDNIRVVRLCDLAYATCLGQ